MTGTKKVVLFFAFVLGFIALYFFGWSRGNHIDKNALKAAVTVLIMIFGFLGKNKEKKNKNQRQQTQKPMPVSQSPIPSVEMSATAPDRPVAEPCVNQEGSRKKQLEQLESLYQCGIISKEEYVERRGNLHHRL